MKAFYELSLTTQGPAYPPSEVMDQNGNFVVIGNINRINEMGELESQWGEALVSAKTQLPSYGENSGYTILRYLTEADDARTLYTLPLPLPCNNYPMVFAPTQNPEANKIKRASLPFHKAYIPDELPEHGRKITKAITLGQWRTAKGQLSLTKKANGRDVLFEIELQGLIPNSLYTVMSLRSQDLDPINPTRPGPLGIPNVLISDTYGNGYYRALMPNPFPKQGGNRIVNIVLLWMSSQMSYGGAIGHYGLGGDIHAQLKFKQPMFLDWETKA